VDDRQALQIDRRGLPEQTIPGSRAELIPEPEDVILTVASVSLANARRAIRAAL
jgi:hypothetical protein